MEMIKELHIINDQTSGNIFTSEERQYIIPLYQREYAWGEKQIVRLIEDISDAEKDNKDAENEKNYYIGTLIVSKRNDKKLEVIDGQQRLTTLFLLLNCLGVTTKTHLTFECRDRSNYTLETIQGKNDLDEKQQEDNIVKGVEIIKRTLEKEEKSNPKFIDALKEKLKKVILFQIIVPPHTDLNRYFEIMNTRGEQLAQHDILKAHLMESLKPEEFERFALIWDACSDMNGYVQMHFTPDDRGSLFNRSWNDRSWNKMPKDETIKKYLSNQGNYSSTAQGGKIEDIICKQPVASVDGINERDERVRFESIIDFPHFLLHTLKVYIHKKKIKVDIGRQLDDKKLIENFKKVEELRNKVPPMYNMYKLSFAREFIICLLQTRFTFDQYIIKREYTSKNEDEDGEWSLKTLYSSEGGNKNHKTAYYRNSTFIHKNQSHQKSNNDSLCKQNLMIQSALRVSYTSPKEMHWITELLIDLCVNKKVTTYQDYPNHIERGMGNEILTFTEKIAATAVNSFISNNKKDNKWKVSGTATPHILFNYLDYLLWKKESQKFNDFTFEFRNSVEHWYPQNPSAEGFAKWDDTPDDTTVDRLGNLCLIQRNVNSRFSNSSPVSKLNSFKGIVEKGSLKLRLMSEATKDDKEWRTKACSEHEEAMIDILEKDLSEKFPSPTTN